MMFDPSLYVYIYIFIILYTWFIDDVYQRKFSWETSELRTIVMASFLTIMVTTSSALSFCHYVNHITMSTTSSSGRERVNPGLKRLSGAKPCVFFG